MSIPKELKEAYQKGYRQFSWVSQLAGREECVTYFEKGRKQFYGERFYWETPEKELILAGFGKELELIKQKASFYNVKKTVKEQKKRRYQNQYISGTGALLFGGFAFDETNLKESIWNEMEYGLFYLPRLMVTAKGTKRYLTLNFSAETELELEENWVALQQVWRKLQQQTVSKMDQAEEPLQTEEVDVSEWLRMVDKTVEKINEAGALEKVVLSRQMKVQQRDSFHVETILRNLKNQQTATYFFVLEANKALFIGATPERLLDASKKYFSTACVAGSIPRGKTQMEDKILGDQLLADSKNRQEHQIVVNQIVHELQKMAVGPILDQQPSILKNRDIQHLYVPIKVTRQGITTFLDAVAALHPTPALGGAPKEAALKWLRENEPMDRGLYGAPIGWVAIKEDVGEFAVGIRSAFFSDNEGYLYAGCGIVKDSQAELERKETAVKFKPMLRGIGGNRNV